MAGFQTILVATDFSPHATAALASAIALAKATNATIQLLYVNDFAALTVAEGTPINDAGVLARVREESRRRLAALQEETKRAGVQSVEATVREGQTYQEIVGQAEQLRADLIVMGTHGRRGFTRLLLGSVAERVVGSARCPVLVVPLKEAASDH